MLSCFYIFSPPSFYSLGSLLLFEIDTFFWEIFDGFLNLIEASSPKQWKWLGKCHSAAFRNRETGRIAMQLTKYQLVIVPQNFSSHRWKSTKYPHDLWNRSKSHQIQKKIPVLYWPTGFPTWFHPCHGLSGDSLCHFESQQTSETQQKAGVVGGARGSCSRPRAQKNLSQAKISAASALLSKT